MHAQSKGVTADVLDRSARAPRVGAHALRVDAAMATRLRVAVVGHFTPPELIKINLDGDATIVRKALVESAAERALGVQRPGWRGRVRRGIAERRRRTRPAPPATRPVRGLEACFMYFRSS